jgi:hypothetical protein
MVRDDPPRNLYDAILRKAAGMASLYAASFQMNLMVGKYIVLIAPPNSIACPSKITCHKPCIARSSHVKP